MWRLREDGRDGGVDAGRGVRTNEGKSVGRGGEYCKEIPYIGGGSGVVEELDI